MSTEVDELQAEVHRLRGWVDDLRQWRQAFDAGTVGVRTPSLVIVDHRGTERVVLGCDMAHGTVTDEARCCEAFGLTVQNGRGGAVADLVSDDDGASFELWDRGNVALVIDAGHGLRRFDSDGEIVRPATGW